MSQTTMEAAASMFSSLDSDVLAMAAFAVFFGIAGVVVYIVSVFGAKEQVCVQSSPDTWTPSAGLENMSQ